MRSNISTVIDCSIVIVGSPRSGTTLLRTILDQHPDLLVHPNEPQFILELYRRYGKTIRDVSAAVDDIAAHRYMSDSVDRQALRAACGHSSPNTLRQIIACYLSVWGGDELPSRQIVLKDPSLVYHLDLVHELFAHAHIVHIIRDPRANVSSQRARWPQFTVWECAMKWRNAVRAARQCQESNRMAFTELRYEDLLLAPERTLQNLCQSLNIPYTETLLSFYQRETVYVSDGIAQELWFTGLDTSRLDAWRKKLSPSDIRLIETCCENEMKWWDYKPDHPTVSTGFELRLTGQRIHYHYRIAGRNAKGVFRKIGWRLGWNI